MASTGYGGTQSTPDVLLLCVLGGVGVGVRGPFLPCRPGCRSARVRVRPRLAARHVWVICRDSLDTAGEVVRTYTRATPGLSDTGPAPWPRARERPRRALGSSACRAEGAPAHNVTSW